ncbi:MAG: antibiotic biosynthesis monooxygenase [Betaproteobacteria bacterium]|nr:antibiotic biosynthesis monooxygenase [Betaproteobacteria bacterium]
MKFALRHWLAAAMLPLMFAQPAFAQTPAPAAAPAPAYDGPMYVVSYIETAPAAAAKTRSMLAAFAKSARKESGNTAFIALQRVGEPNFFTVLEAWKDKDAQVAHVGAAGTRAFRDGLEPMLRAPYDERPHMALAAQPLKAAAKSAVYVVTHVDIVPTSKDLGIDLNKTLAEAARAEPGAISFDLWQQGSRPNHLTLVEAWKDRKSLDTHNSADAVKTYRGKFASISGSPYDIRVFRAID